MRIWIERGRNTYANYQQLKNANLLYCTTGRKSSTIRSHQRLKRFYLKKKCRAQLDEKEIPSLSPGCAEGKIRIFAEVNAGLNLVTKQK